MATMKKKGGNTDTSMKRREEGFDLNSIPHAKLREYNALHDANMRHYFENPNVQRLLYESGQIDRHGRVINMEKNKSKLKILEREFRDAERMEERRLKEEMEMRVNYILTIVISFVSLTLNVVSRPTQAISTTRGCPKARCYD
jgi:hypothetical protein